MGSHLVEALLRNGDHVRIFDRPRADRRNLVKILADVELVEGDLTNESDLRAAMRDIEVAFHLVCTTLPKTSNENPIYDVETNIAGTLKLLDVARSSGVRKVVFPSSGGTVYGMTGAQPVVESHPTNPLCSYGITKLAIEKYLQLYWHLHGLSYTILRISNPYGPRQDMHSIQGAIGVFLPKVMRGELITIWGDGSTARDFLFIDDLVSALVRASAYDGEFRLLNIGSGEPTTLLELLSTIEQVTGKPARVVFSPSRKFDVPVNCLDVSRAKAELGWSPLVPLKDGIERTFRWLGDSG